MIIFGWGKVIRSRLGFAGMQHCPTCQKSTGWTVEKVSRWFTVFFIPVFPYASEHYLVCSRCSGGIALTPQEARELIA